MQNDILHDGDSVVDDQSGRRRQPPSVIRLKLWPIIRSAISWDYKRPDDGTAPIAQEQNQDDRRRNQTDQNRVADTPDRISHQCRLIVEGLQFYAAGQRLPNLIQSRLTNRPPIRCCCQAGGKFNRTAGFPLALTMM